MSEKNGGSLEVEGFGLRTRVRGHDIIVVILLVLMFGVILFFMWQNDRNLAALLSAQAVHNEEVHQALATNQKNLTEHMEDMIYVLSLSEKDRQKLKLAMPDSLRKRKRIGDDQ
jgi:hypothetical protein